MPEIIATAVYRLDELTPSAKDAARRWYRADVSLDDWHEFVLDDFATVAGILGVELSTHIVRLHGGGTRSAPNIWYSGISSQGDGACFEGRYRYAKGVGSTIRAHAPQDVELHRIADALAAIQRRNFYRLHADVRHHGRYHHEYWVQLMVERSGPTERDITAEAEQSITEALRALARWLYRQLEQEYDDQSSDAMVDDAILANDYQFTEGGTRFS